MWETILGGGLAASLIITIEKFAEFLISLWQEKIHSRNRNASDAP